MVMLKVIFRYFIGSDLHNSFKSEVLTQGDKEKTAVEKAKYVV